MTVEHLGNQELLKLRKTAFLASSTNGRLPSLVCAAFLQTK